MFLFIHLSDKMSEACFSFDYILISLRLLLYHNLDLGSGTSFRWQYALSMTGIVWIMDFADSEGQETNSIFYRHRLTAYATAERSYILISYQTYTNSKKQTFPLTLYFIYDILKIYYVL